MNKYQELIKFIQQEHKLNVIDITKKLTIHSYQYYSDLAVKYPTNVYIAKKTLKSTKLFNILASMFTDETNKATYLLIKNDNYHISGVFKKSAISKFVSAIDDNMYECGICKELSLLNNICENCTFQLCSVCVKSLYLTNNFNCPQCRIPYELYHNKYIHDIRKKYNSEYKFNTQ